MFALNPPTTGSSRTLPGLRLGQVTRLLGPNLTITGQIDDVRRSAIGVGSLAKISGTRDLIGIINSIEIDPDSRWECLLSIALVGEIIVSPQGAAIFHRGVSRYPPLGEEVTTVTPADLQSVYARPSVPNIRIGRLGNNELQPAFVMTDELLAKHFAVLGSTGCGKSCSVSVILSELLDAQPNAHVILLDPHNEYSAAFGDRAELLNVQSASLPFWLLNLEEAVQILVRGGSLEEQQVQAGILKDALRQARQRYANGERIPVTVDTPVPFPVHELTRNLREAMGQINKSETAAPYRRLETQLASLMEDRRFAFMFRDSYAADDTLSELVGRLLRIPVEGKPISILDLSGVPSEIADVVVSVTARISSISPCGRIRSCGRRSCSRAKRRTATSQRAKDEPSPRAPERSAASRARVASTGSRWRSFPSGRRNSHLKRFRNAARCLRCVWPTIRTNTSSSARFPIPGT